MRNTGTVRAAIYCRMSLAKFDDKTKIEDQERICRELARYRDWAVAEGVGYPLPNGVFSDNNRSAWQPNRKRPGWDAMLSAVESGKINAIVTYHGDRLVRRHEDLSALIGFAKAKGVRLASPTGESDLDDYDDQFKLEIEVSVAKRESANTSRRRKAQYERWRREGKVRAGGRGGRAFAFGTDGTTQVPAEAELVREAASRVLAGEGISAICRDWAGRGVVTTTGIPFGHTSLRRTLARPRYAGLMPDGISAAAWQPVLNRETWELLRAALDTRAGGYGYATNARRHLLSGIALCGAPGCGRPLTFRYSKGRGGRRYQAGYACTGCRKVWRDREHLDLYAARMTVNRLNDPRNPEPRAPDTPGLAAEYAALTRQLADVSAALADYTRGAVGELLARRDGIERRLGELRQLTAGDAAARLRARHAGISWEEFLGLPLPLRRSLVAACFRVTVLPASKRGPGFRAGDVDMTPL